MRQHQFLAQVALTCVLSPTESSYMSDAKILVRDHGPLLVTGPITVTDAAGNVFDLKGKETFALCRCGASANRPFCDGAHKTCGFRSEERAVPG